MVVGRVDWMGRARRLWEAGCMDPNNFPSGWKGGDQCERWFRRTDMELGRCRGRGTTLLH